MTAHVCHAEGCGMPVQPRFLMCRKHWFMLPGPIQREIWATYVPGQEIRKDPTPEYMQAYRKAVNAVASKEGRPQPFATEEAAHA